MTTVYLAPGPFGAGGQFFGLGGLPLSGGLIYTYEAGGTTPQATYTTSAGNVQNANPIVLSADGRANEIWLTSATYRFDLKDRLGNLIKTYDNLSGINSTLASLTAPSGSSVVGFEQSVTGAVPRTVEEKLREVQLSAIDAGGLFDSITDNATAIQNCVNDGRPCYLPSGIAKIATGINLTTAAAHGITIYGAGPSSNTGTGTNKTIIQPSAAVTGGAFKIDGSGIGLAIQNCRFRDFTIDMANMTDVSTNYGFRQMSAYGGNYENIQIINDGSNKRGFKFETGAYTTVLNNCKSNLIEAAGTSLGNAVTTLTFIGCAFSKFIGSQCVGLTFLQPIVQGALDKFDLTSIGGIRIFGGDIEGTGNYLKITGAAVSHVHSAGNEFSGFSGTYLSGTPTSSQLADFYGLNGLSLSTPSGGSVAFSVTDFVISFLKTAASIFRTTLQNSNAAAQQVDIEFKSAVGSAFFGQTSGGKAIIDVRGGGGGIIQDTGTDKVGYSSDNKFYLATSTASSANTGANGAPPAQVAGYFVIKTSGSDVKIPYYNT